MSLLRRLYRPVVTGRALLKSNTTPSPDDSAELKTVAHIPREFAKDTIEFFRQSSPHVKSLLDLVFNTNEPVPGDCDKQISESRARYMRHEEKARRRMFDAIRHLPSDMYEEAVQKGNMLPPASLQFHAMYRDQLKAELDDRELVDMQTYANLMHVRYSHSEAKAKHRDRFFISESAALNLRKERAKKEKTGK